MEWPAVSAVCACLGLIIICTTFLKNVLRETTESIVLSLNKIASKLDTHVEKFDEHVRDDIEIQSTQKQQIAELLRRVSVVRGKNDDVA